jgi:glycosyltransferase involved in cell wall biosynthesis
MSGMPTEPDRRRERPDDEPVEASNAGPTERDELALHPFGERAREFEGVSLAPAEERGALRTERRRGDVDDAHLRLSLVTLGDPAQRTGGYRYHRIMAAAAPEHDAHVRFVSIRQLPWVLPFVEAASTVRRAAERSDAILLDSIAAAFVAPWIRGARRPVIAVVHQPPGGMDHGLWRGRPQAALDRLAYSSATGFIAASESLVEDLKMAGAPPARIHFVPPGCDVPITDAPPLDLRRGRAASLLCVANWTPRKGVLELLDAFAALPPEAATLWLVGATDADRRYARRVRRRLTSRDLATRVIVVGAVAVGDVGRLYRSADAFALPSFVDPYGTAWAEAIGSGLPVVGWRTGNLPRLAEHGREALFVDAGDIRGLAAALDAVVSDTSLRERLAAAARARARTLPTWSRSAERFFGAVRNIMASLAPST